MRIAIVSRNARRIGGVESYLAVVARELTAAGHDLALLHEVDVPVDRPPAMSVDSVPRWCVADLGAEQAVDSLRRWAPDVIYAHGIVDVALEHATLSIAPVVFHAHGYHGTCISGGKMFQSPRPRPCQRRFGAACLALYYPRRCGGWHPRTMWREYRRQRRRQQFLEGCTTIVTASRHLAAEYANHIASLRIVVLPLPIGDISDHGPAAPQKTGASLRDEWRLLFLGRMDRFKGGHMFLHALPTVAAAARRPIRVTFAGDGPEVGRLSSRARELEAATAGLTIGFVGWVGAEAREDLFKSSDLLVVPSVLPEPFGLVGLEAARYGIPAAAFAVGGIPEWLDSGVSGRLAPGDPPTVGGLATAIVDCLRDPETYRRLSAGAFAAAARSTRAGHARELCDILSKAADRRHAPSASV